jgi:hypothetical protein
MAVRTDQDHQLRRWCNQFLTPDLIWSLQTAPRTQLGFIWQPSRPRPCQRELGLGPHLPREEQDKLDSQ